MKRSIILFPKFDNLDMIKRIREMYDPLANCIDPHITIVFPFDSDISTDMLKSHFDHVLNGMKKFHVQLKGFSGDLRDGYLFLDVKRGNDSIIELHDRLYGGILAGHLYKKTVYHPHLTVGRLHERMAFEKALNELGSCMENFETEIDRVYVEQIDENESSIIEFSFELK